MPVACAMAATARADGSHACLSGAQLTRLFGWGHGDRTAARHLKALRDAGWLVQTERGGRRGKVVKASVYALAMPTRHLGGRLAGESNSPRPWRVGDDSQPATGHAPTRHLGGGPLSLTGTRGPGSSADASEPCPRATLIAAASKVTDADAERWVRQARDGLGAVEATAVLLAARWRYDVDGKGWPWTGDVDVDDVFLVTAVYASAVKASRASAELRKAYGLTACRTAVADAASHFDGDRLSGWSALLLGADSHSPKEPATIVRKLDRTKPTAKGAPVGSVALRGDVRRYLSQLSSCGPPPSVR
ncbi:MAG: hypothetical protein JWL79_2935 [Frankiales bacterium]|nr:hypothetical protein [Frankiales bacterium]